MRTLTQSTVTIGLAAALLAACGRSQPPIDAPSGGPQSRAIEPTHTVAHHKVPGSSFQVLYSFAGSPDGESPEGSLTNVSGTLYGTTESGGADGNGTVFAVATSGAENVLYSFSGPPDGAAPRAGLVDAGGTFYGTTGNGGSHERYGTVFAITPSDSEKVVYSFGGSDGAHPWAALIDVGGTLYGTTSAGGHPKSKGYGTVFSLTPSGTEKVLHIFGHGKDGVYPEAPLIDVGGRLYGTTAAGGAYGAGTVFTITTSGAEKVLYSFRGQPDGRGPVSGLVDMGGILYGTTISGGPYDGGHGREGCTAGCGTVYSISTSGNEKVLHGFGNGVGHRRHDGGLIPRGSLIGLKGRLYGTTAIGGSYVTCGESGCGTIFSMSTSGSEKVLHRFKGSDGENPAGFTNVSGTLYGTTQFGGTYGHGTVFALTP